MPVEDRDLGWKRIVAALGEVEREGPETVCKVGFLEGDKNERSPSSGGSEAPSNAELAMIHEFGSPEAGVPERSFIRATFDAKREQYEHLVEKLSGEVIDGRMKVGKLLGLVGAKMASDIRRTVTTGAGVPPANAPSTVKRKGSSRPLVDSKQMLNALTWLVTQEGGAE